jgi:hypothetical protein
MAAKCALKSVCRGMLLAMSPFLLSGCGFVAGSMAQLPGPLPCPQLRSALLIPDMLSPNRTAPKVAVVGIAGPEPAKVELPVAFRYDESCWLRTGVNKQIFRDALQTTLDLSGLAVPADEGRAADFYLEVWVMEQLVQESLLSPGLISRRASLAVRYSLKSPQTRKLLLAKEVATAHEVRYGLRVEGSPTPGGASVMAVEGAIRQNLQTFARYLAGLEKK